MNRIQPLGALVWSIATISILVVVAFILEHLAIIVGVLLMIVFFGLGAYLIYQATRNRPRWR